MHWLIFILEVGGKDLGIYFKIFTRKNDMRLVMWLVLIWTMVTVKLAGATTPWWLVLAPLWAPFVVVLFVFFSYMIAGMLSGRKP